MRTLLVEDDTGSRLLLEAVLRKRGHDTVVCTDGEEALTACGRGSFDLVVLDWLLPGMDGAQLCRRIRSLPWGDVTYVLVITSCTSSDDLEAVLAAGADDYLAKPVDPGMFNVRMTIARHQLTNLRERKGAEAALRESERRYSELIENVPCGVYESTPEGRFLSVNQALVQMLGYASTGELLGVEIPSELYACRSDRGKLLDQLVREGSLSNAEIALLDRQGNRLTVLLNALVKRDSHGKVVSFQGATVDITERKRIEEALLRAHGDLETRVAERTAELAAAVAELRAEIAERQRVQEALQQSEQDYRSIFENAHDPIIVFSAADQSVLDINQRGCEVYGYTREELIGQPLAVITGDTDDEPGQAGHRPGSGETTHYRRDGVPITIDCNTAPIRYRGQPAVLSVNRDITERRVLEHRLRQAQKLEALGQLAGTIAHDFNNLITAILATSELLHRRLGEDHPLAGELAIICRASQSAADLTRSLLAYARQRMLQPLDLDLNQLVAQMLPMLRRLLPEQVLLRHLPGSDLGNVRADRSQIEQVVMNLVTNARDALADSGAIVIETGNQEIGSSYVAEHPWAREGSYVYVSVSDDGIGMDQATQAQIFDIFFTTKEGGKGTGLGLASVYGSVKQHGGILDVTSQPGRGSCFKVLLPEQEPRSETAESVRPEGEVPATGERETILVVEDYDDLREVVVDSVESLGFQALAAADGVEALRILQDSRNRVQLVVTDMTMPRMDGIELFRRARERDPDLAFIFCTGQAGEWESLAGFEDTRTFCLEKPFTIDTLGRRIRKVLEVAPRFCPP